MPFFTRPLHWLLLLLCTLTAAWFLLWNLGSPPLEPWDEPQFATMQLQMIRSHDWFHLRDMGQPYFAKPPLAHWIGAASEDVFGPSEWSSRFPEALAGVLTVMLLAYWAWKKCKTPWAMPLVTLLFVASHIYFSHSFRNADTDGIMMLLMTLSLFLYEKAKTSSLWIIACAVSLGLLIMTKSAEAAVPVLIIIADIVLTASWKWFSFRHVLIGLTLVLLIAVPWHVAMTIAYGSAFWHEYIGLHVFARWATDYESPHTAWNYYWGVHLWDLASLMIVMAPALLTEARALLRDRERGSILLWMLWFLIGEFVINAAVTKQPWYADPFCIPLFLLTADAVIRWWKNPDADWLTTVSLLWIAAAALVLHPCTNNICSPLTSVAHGNPLSTAVLIIVLVMLIGVAIGKIAPGFAQWHKRVIILVLLALVVLPQLKGNIDTINAMPSLPDPEGDLVHAIMQQPGSGKTLILLNMSPAQFRLGQFDRALHPDLRVLQQPAGANLASALAQPNVWIERPAAETGIIAGFQSVGTWGDMEVWKKER